MQQEPKFFRKQHVIRDADSNIIFEGAFKAKVNGSVVDVPSINAAKRKMRELVEANGHGSGRVVT
jgi:hypothetical protein